MNLYRYLNIPCINCGAASGEYCRPKIDGDERSAERFAQCAERLREDMRQPGTVFCGQCVRDLTVLGHSRHGGGGEING
jgi:hypothetical protein